MYMPQYYEYPYPAYPLYSPYPIPLNYEEDERFFAAPFLTAALLGGVGGFAIGALGKNCCGYGAPYPYPYPMPYQQQYPIMQNYQFGYPMQIQQQITPYPMMQPQVVQQMSFPQQPPHAMNTIISSEHPTTITIKD